MSTKTVDQQTSQFDPTSMGTFQALQPAFRQNMLDFMNNPMQSMFFNTQMQMQNAQNRAYFGNSQNILNQNLAAGGYVGNAPAFAQMNMLNNSRALSGANANTFNSLLLGANQLRFGATQGAGSYNPLRVGQTTTKSQSGLGTWLPQVAGMAIKAGTMAATGGASGLFDFGSAFSSPAGNVGTPQDPNSFAQPDMGSMPSPWTTAPSTSNFGMTNT